MEYVTEPRVLTWQPETVHLGGGAVVTVSGVNLRRHDRSLLCVFATGPSVGASGGVSGFAPAASAAAVVSTALAACETPGGLTEGVAALTLTLAGGVGTRVPTGVPTAVVPGPTLHDVFPSAGATEGGAAVSLVGRFLRRGNDLAARVGVFGPVALRPGSSGGSAELVAPAHVPRLVAIRASRSLADEDATGPGLGWRYRSPFVPIDTAMPGAVAAAGGGRVRLHGLTGELPPDHVALEASASPSDGRLGRTQFRRGGGHSEFGDPDRVNEASVTAVPVAAPGFYVLEVNAGGSGHVVGAMPQLEHRVGAAVHAVHPRAAMPGGGGTLLDVVGRDFVVGETAVRLGEFTVSGAGGGTVVSSALLRMEAAGDHHHDTQTPAEVASSSDAVEDAAAWSLDGVLVAFHRVPAAHHSSPAFGTEEGGTACTLTGREFRDGGAQLKCQFGSTVVVAAAFVSMNHVECVSPAHLPSDSTGPARLAVANNGRDFSGEVTNRGSLVFAYGPRLEVFGLDPNQGPASGGTSVTVYGANFAPPQGGNSRPAFQCRFGHKAVPASVAGSHRTTEGSAVCRAPPHHVGFVTVEVSAGPGNFTTFGVTFEYQAAAVPDVLFPPTGLASGGTLVTVAGANFIASNQQFGYGHGETQQPGSGGGIFLGSGSDQMKGRDPLACRFGDAYTVGASAVSSAVLRCETPVFSDAAIDRVLSVDTSNNGGEDFSGWQTYFEPLAETLVLSLSPNSGTKVGGTVVSVFGQGITVNEPVWCRFGAVGPIPAEFLRDGAVQCKSPARGTGQIPVEISRGNTFDFSRNNVLFSV